ncbi:DmsC/YnfH family molybdoenzyme membrane anchor subunit [Denitrobacterium detoxificans]|uniref:DmsC/YnfH family molybdoenzyme membrane anchor subunit n=1 Tax=Denitrobacterium detoxificans TaxID=79604 RepID=UPI0026EA4011|nr:DmsC/YnfH family molybdoenzyme membrane anchor subunit [Denitrobacterium detoxificans]MBE6466769.1 hypothetical protein [Denitrobacterium detoxificans]
MISEFPLFVYTVLAGIAAGGYVTRAMVPLKAERKAPWAFALACLIMLAIGGVALLCHLGQPLRVLYAFSNPTAGIAQEGVTTVLFGVAVLGDMIFCITKKESPRWLIVVAAAFGVALTIAMGLAYTAFLGTPAWANPATVPFFVVPDLAMGVGFYLMFNNEALSSKLISSYGIVMQILSAVCVAAVGAHFAGLGLNVVPFVVGIVCLVCACALTVVARKGEKPWAASAICALAIIGVAIARYSFYTASIV